MAKNHQKESDSSAGIHADEYRIIKHDLIKVLILNLIYLSAVLALYFSNLKSNYLEIWFAKVFRF
jgi:hypothetical protein